MEVFNAHKFMYLIISLDTVLYVLWIPSGDKLATALYDELARVIDFKTGKLVYSEYTTEGSKESSPSVIILHIFTRTCQLTYKNRSKSG